MTNRPARCCRAALAPALLVLLAGLSPARAITFAPGTSQEHIERVQETFRRSQGPHEGIRFTPAGPRQALIFVDPREADPSERDYDIWWSYAPDGLATPPSDATLFHISPFLRIGQTVGTLDPEDPRFDNFQSSLFFQLNNLPRPYGFAQDGGQVTWQTIVKQAIDRWEQISGIDFHFVPGPEANAISDQPNPDSGGPWNESNFGFRGTSDGSIRIAMVEIDGAAEADGSTGSILAYSYDSRRPPIGDRDNDNNTPDDGSDDFENLGYLSNILLDNQEKWNDPATPNLFATVIARQIGFSLGLFPACPTRPAVPFALMQEQLVPLNPVAVPPFDPVPPLFFQEPQEDDLRAIHSLYGDPLESYIGSMNTTTYADANDIPYLPVPNSNVFTYAPHLGIPQEIFGGAVTQLSIHNAADIDRFRISLPDTVISATLEVTITPLGTPYVNGMYIPGVDPVPALHGACDNSTTPTDPSAARNLRLVVEAFDPFVNILTVLDDQDVNPAGMGEATELPVTSGTFFISILSNDLINDVQLYDLVIRVTTPEIETGIDALQYLEQIGVDAIRDEGYFGGNVTIGVVEGQHPSDGHQVFAGRPLERINWPGVDPATTGAGSHATTIAAVAAGAPFGTFEGVAPEAQIVSGTVSTQVFGDGTFSVGKNALYFALFGMTNPNLSASLGLVQPASVVVSTWGGGGRSLTGEDTISQAYDAAASASMATFVVAAGNNGRAEGRSFPNCPITVPDPLSPGVEYKGSRSIVPPATAMNVISVGAVGFVDPLGSPIEFQDQELVVPGFSSRGPIDSGDFSAGLGGGTIPDARAGVDILAPGTGVVRIPPNFSGGGPGLDPCDYQGPVPISFIQLPGIAPGDDPDSPAVTDAFRFIQGTSVSAAIVAGAVALLQDLALDQNPPLSIHPSVMKAILLNNATKLEGWTNTPAGPGRPQDQRDGFDRNPALQNNPDAPLVYNIVAVTENPLDRTQGAGVLDLRRSLENYFLGYPPALPPQAQFAGPTIDPPQTDPRIPTIRMPDEPGGTGGPGGAGTAAADPIDPKFFEDPPSLIEVGHMLRAIRGGDEPSVIVAREMQAGGGQIPDLKGGLGPPAAVQPTGPLTPFLPPSLGGPGPGGGTPGPGAPPGAVDPGVAPREIAPIFVDPIGWDDANIDQRPIRLFGGGTIRTGFIDYVINVPLLPERPDPDNPSGDNLPADRLTVTLCWQRLFELTEVNFSNPNNPRIGSINALELENLDLFVYATDALGNIAQDAVPVRSSISTFNTTEHIFLDIPQPGLYLIRVQWLNTEYDLFNRRPLAEQRYGLAWRVDFSPRPEAGRPTGVADLVSVINHFGGAVGNERYLLDADVNHDGVVDWRDIMRVIRNWRRVE